MHRYTALPDTAARRTYDPLAGRSTAETVAAFGDDTTAVLVYYPQTANVSDAPTAECVTVADGKITRSVPVFDRPSFAPAAALRTGDGPRPGLVEATLARPIARGGSHAGSQAGSQWPRCSQVNRPGPWWS